MTPQTTVAALALASDNGHVIAPVGVTGVPAVATWLLLLLPLAGAALLLFAGRRIPPARVGWVATGVVATSFLLALVVLLDVAGRPDVVGRSLVVPGYTWISVGGLEVTTDLFVDPLSLTLVAIITGVGTLIHAYSIGYMHGDEREPRYFAYLNLFVFSMLLLVLGANLVVLFVGWELVGLCSYLLIGFWFEEAKNAVAAKKAFIVNRVGDVSFAIGLFFVFTTFGTLALPEILPVAGDVLADQRGIATAIGLLLLGGAVGKSAQIPLYVWLPDAMAGPTPVSALIHAATMVTAGVYMVSRVWPIYVQAPGALQVVAVIGAATALLAALIAVQQDDIKMVLAYSTVSQLGFMFIGVGVGAFGLGIFHLMTHAFFKALLFLAAGSVMHAMANRTDMWEMGGLRKVMPVTFGTSVIAVLAISGVPPFAGFFSKDQILHAAFEAGHFGVWVTGVVTAGVTAFYMARWLIVPFLGEPRWGRATRRPSAEGEELTRESHPEAGHTTEGEEPHPHESPRVMTVPLVVLAVLSVVGGLVNWHHPGPFERWLGSAAPYAVDTVTTLPVVVSMVLATVVAAAGIGLAWLVYRDNPVRDPLPERLGALSLAMRRRFWVDDLYGAIFVRGGGRAADRLAWFDSNVIDGAVNGTGRLTLGVARGARRLQPGLVRLYVLGVILGTFAVVVAFLVQAV